MYKLYKTIYFSPSRVAITSGSELINACEQQEFLYVLFRCVGRRVFNSYLAISVSHSTYTQTQITGRNFNANDFIGLYYFVCKVQTYF